MNHRFRKISVFLYVFFYGFNVLTIGGHSESHQLVVGIFQKIDYVSAVGTVFDEKAHESQGNIDHIIYTASSLLHPQSVTRNNLKITTMSSLSVSPGSEDGQKAQVKLDFESMKLHATGM